MFRADLQRRIEEIFGFKKTTLNAPSDEFEQDTLFIEVNFGNTKVSGKQGSQQTARVVGRLIVYSQDNRLPFGFFAKRIDRASKDTTKPFFFYDIDLDDPASPARIQNIHERTVSFVFLYESQYDPDKGQITELNLSCEE